MTENILSGKKIIIGITGSIAAYKIPFLIRELVKSGAVVHVVLTPSAKEFVTPITLANISRNPVICDMFDENSQKGGAWHIHLAHECDLMMIAPCSASTLGKLANGICDNALVTLATAVPSITPVIVAPAMDSTMWLNPVTQRNVRTLKNDGLIIIEPKQGELSSGIVGPGRLPEPDKLLEKIKEVLTFKISKEEKLNEEKKEIISEKMIQEAAEMPIPTLDDRIEKDKWTAELELTNLKKKLTSESVESRLMGKKVMITAGPTREKIDDVRFISNHSSGKMGFALAEEARNRGAEVVLISGPVSLSVPEGIKIINVVSAREMYEKSIQEFVNSDIAILAAAVSDYTLQNPVTGKIKKTDTGGEMNLNLVLTKDILSEIGRSKTENQFLVGFALESENEIENGRKKLKEKNCDMMIVNSASKPRSGFGGYENTITILTNDGTETSYPPMSKKECSVAIIDKIIERYGV